MNIILFGDNQGIPQLLRHVPNALIGAIIAAEIRPHAISFLKDLADKMEIPFLIQPITQKREYSDFIASIKEIKPELLLCISYSMLIGADVLQEVECASVNIHGGLLPQYRGCSPTQWSIINGEDMTGVTMHEMSNRFDTGNIIAIEEIPLHFTDTWLDVQKRLSGATDKLLEKNINSLLDCSWRGTQQDESEANYYRRRKPEDGFFSWKKNTPREIYNLIRALVSPLPGAFYFDNDGQKIIMDSYLDFESVQRLHRCLSNKLSDDL